MRLVVITIPIFLVFDSTTLGLSSCSDEADWVVNATTDVLRPFKGSNCEQLKDLVSDGSDGGTNAWCNFHRMNTDVGKSAAEACCFCGGGSDVPEPCVDTQNWSLDESGVDDTITCSFISRHTTDSSLFCGTVQNVVGSKGQTAFDACCVCGGGYRPYLSFTEIFPSGISSPSPTINDDPTPSATTSPTDYPTIGRSSSPSVSSPQNDVSCGGHRAATCSECPQGNGSAWCNGDCKWDSSTDSCVGVNSGRRLYNRSSRGTLSEDTDWESDFALGGSDDNESFPPGISNLEYLGLGYDGLRGNPRGTSNSQIDPGFSSRVLALTQTQDYQTIDGQFTNPIGTEFKYTSSCHYDSQSREISTEQDLISSISSEAVMTNTNNKSSSSETQVSTDLSVGVFGIGFDGEKSRSRSTSEYKSQAFGKSDEVLKYRESFINESVSAHSSSISMTICISDQTCLPF